MEFVNSNNQTILRERNGLSQVKVEESPTVLINSSSLHRLPLNNNMNESNREKLETYNCVICQYSTTNITKFTNHWISHMNISLKQRKTKPLYYDCDMCNYKARTKGTLKQHRRLHTGEKSFKCKLCNYRGRQSSNLQSHMYKHTGDMPYNCEDCNYVTAYKAAMVQHKRLHTGEKPFRCKLCKYRGRQLSNLQLHMKKHGDDR